MYCPRTPSYSFWHTGHEIGQRRWLDSQPCRFEIRLQLPEVGFWLLFVGALLSIARSYLMPFVSGLFPDHFSFAQKCGRLSRHY